MRTRLLTITLAVVLAMLGVVAVLSYVRQANERAVNGLKAETVMFATRAIPAGTSLSKAQAWLGTEKVPDSSLTNPAVQSVTRANEHLVVSGTVPKGQVLLQSMLASAASVTANGGFLVPAGMQAVSAIMCVGEAVADYLTPGSYVAVYDTVESSPNIQRTCVAARSISNGGAIRNNWQNTTQLVLKKAEVLAVGQNPGTQSTSGDSSGLVAADPSNSSSSSQDEVLVTLAVNQADAERLILIEEIGLPYMALLGSSSNAAFTPPVDLFQPQEQP